MMPSITRRTPPPRFRHAGPEAALTIAAAAALALGAAALAAGATGHRPGRGWRPAADAYDWTFLRHMTTHHRQGIELARMARAQACRPDLRALAGRMLADDEATARLLVAWWRRWAGGPMPPVAAAERRRIAGLQPPERLDDVARRDDAAFDRCFLPVMIAHDRGAVRMARRAAAAASDRRLRRLAQTLAAARSDRIAAMERLLAGPPPPPPFAKAPLVSHS